ncbi:MAG: hypothetical protein JO316_21870 [Abitibacteriaceae bacterium]|nr:hypothetical protein [Abditibacteriaceae bacterium]
MPVFQKWWQAVTTPGATTSRGAGATSSRPLVSINVAAIATHHPAWRLADALEHNNATAVRAMPLSAPAHLSLTTPLPAPVPFGPLQVAEPGGSVGFYRPERKVTVGGLGALQAETRIREERALNDFIVAAAERQQQAHTAWAKNLRATLEEQLDAAQRLSLSELTPDLPSDPIQLEMTNLRLALLRNLYTTAKEQEQARQKLRDLEAQWEVKLRDQESQRLAELTRLREERPKQLRKEGEARINATIAEAAQRNITIRENVVREHGALLAEDFDKDNAQLGIVLPAASLPPQQLPSDVNPAAALTLVEAPQRQSNLSKTLPGKPTSVQYHSLQAMTNPQKPQATGGQGQRAVQIKALRALAWKDARRWAHIAVRRAGWDWNEATQNVRGAVPDRTQEVLRILNLS